MKVCSTCNKKFATNESKAQHIRDAHGSYPCVTCSKTFNSEAALQQHRDAKHRQNRRGRGSTTRNRRAHEHDPPHANIQGYWISRDLFKGDKSFGQFQCSKCSKRWGSAHAYQRYEQGCQRCETRSLPCCLWVNTGARSDYHDFDEDDGPHDSGRCEACRRGVCTFLR